jgi:hypothetical protein
VEIHISQEGWQLANVCRYPSRADRQKLRGGGIFILSPPFWRGLSGIAQVPFQSTQREEKRTHLREYASAKEARTL